MRFCLVIQGSLVQHIKVNGILRRAVIVYLQPVVDAVNGQVAGQVGFQVIGQQAASAASHIEIQEKGCLEVICPAWKDSP